VLDILLVAAMGMAILILVLILTLREPLEFSAFPSVLLLVTLFRLALNVASTRQILLNADAGNVIQSFGDFVVGGSYVVGLVIFAILTTINFKVITAGSGRIAEVAARFTLDAMPGKQMSIDADLNQGLIDEAEAMARREKLRREADFYGAMDGASKFVKGDAVAGLIIAVINITAGFAIGMLQKDMTAAESAARFTILTIGDGLVSQIPAIVISTAAGILVTRAASSGDLGTEVSQQLLIRPGPLLITGGVLVLFSLAPGLPFIPFVLLGGAVGGLGWVLSNRQLATAAAGTANALPAGTAGGSGQAIEGRAQRALHGDKSKKPEPPPSSVAGLKSVLNVSPMDLEIGFGLIPLVDRNQGGKLIERISNVRSQVASDLGIVMPPVNVRDNVSLRNTDYRIKIRGLEAAGGSVRPGSLMAIDPSGEVKLEGYTPVHEPAFGFQAYWIPENKREMAESRKLTVVDCASVITTHLASVVNREAADLLTRQDVSDLVEQLKETHPAVVQELIPAKLSIGHVHRVMQGLLRERVPVRDLPVILETLADHAGRTQEVTVLVELCRRALGARITRDHMAPDGSLKAIGLHPDLEALIRKASHRENVAFGHLALDPAAAREILQSIRRAADAVRGRGLDPVLVCSPSIRPQVRQLIQHDFSAMTVLSLAEIPEAVRLEVIHLVPMPANIDTETLLAESAK